MKTFILLFLCFFPFSGKLSTDNSKHKFHDPDTRNKIAKNIIESFAKQNYDTISVSFHSSLKQTLPTEKLQEIWQTVSSQMGGFTSIISYTPSVVQTYNVVSVRCKFEKDNLTMDVTFNQDDKVIGLFFRA